MGTFFSKRRELWCLQKRMDLIEEKADLNGDGVVTKKELKEYAAGELQLKDSEILNLRCELSRLQQEITELKEKKHNRIIKAEREADKWKDAYNELYKRQEELINNIQDGKNKKDPNDMISNQAIEKFVDDMLADPNINIYLLPDSIEKPIYMNILKIMLSVLQKTFNHTNLDLIGHEFKIRMKPTNDNIKKNI